MFKTFPLFSFLCFSLLPVAFAQADSAAPATATANSAGAPVDDDRFAINEDEWELIINKNGVQTYRMRHKGTAVQTFKGVTFVDAKIEVIGEVLRDIPSYPKWMAKFKDTQILKTIDRNTYVFHTGIKTPFIYENRDLVVENKTTYNFDNGTAFLQFWAAKDYQYPAQKGYFRIDLLEGNYLLEYFGRDKTRVSYQYRSDPGGNIPVAIANEVEMKFFPTHTLVNLRDMVKQDKYIKGGLASPEHDMIEKMLDDRSKVEIILRNRLSEYITDKKLLDSVFAMPEAQNLVDGVYKNRSDFASIRAAMVGLFKLMSSLDQQPALKAQMSDIMAYLKPKELGSFFNMEKFMGELWLVDEIAKQPEIINNMFNEKSPLAKELFEKITSSEVAVKSFIRSKRLAKKILENPGVRQKLWDDEMLRKELAEKLPKFKTLDDFEQLVASRVNTY
jgi:hypothetical protein